MLGRWTTPSVEKFFSARDQSIVEEHDCFSNVTQLAVHNTTIGRKKFLQKFPVSPNQFYVLFKDKVTADLELR